MNTIHHRVLDTNGIRMHIAEQGEGPLVILCHGWPESWYSWRHQLPALAGAGYHVVAPDQRGYGQTDKPEAIEEYHILKLTADIVGLVHALGEKHAVIVGHDWGAPVAWHCALLRPDIFRVLGLLSVPYLQRSWTDPRPTVGMKHLEGDQFHFYQSYFQEPGKAEAEFEADIRKSLLAFLYSASGDPPPAQRWRFLFKKSETLMDSVTVPTVLPSWLTEQDLEFFVQEFTRSGFRGGLNWYRNIDRMWEFSAPLCGAQIQQPTLFVAGEVDAVLTMYPDAVAKLEQAIPNLTKKVILPGAGHWIQQERPTEVNRLLLEFLGRV